jgi:tetratricopeptide (TPR) repeat protein
MNVRKDYQQAEQLFRRALVLDPEGLNQHANYASLELILAHLDSAREHAQWAVNHGGDDPSQTVAEALFYLSLCDSLQEDELAAKLGCLKSLFYEGYLREDMCFDSLYEEVSPILPDELQTLYRQLGDAILDEKKLPVLETNPLWQKVEMVPWETAKSES